MGAHASYCEYLVLLCSPWDALGLKFLHSFLALISAKISIFEENSVRGRHLFLVTLEHEMDRK